MHKTIGCRMQDIGYRLNTENRNQSVESRLNTLPKMRVLDLSILGKSIGKGVDGLGSIVHKMCTKITPLHPSNFGFWVQKTIPLFYPLTPQPIPQVRNDFNGFERGLFKSVHTIHSTNNNNEVIYKDL